MPWFSPAAPHRGATVLNGWDRRSTLRTCAQVSGHRDGGADTDRERAGERHAGTAGFRHPVVAEDSRERFFPAQLFGHVRDSGSGSSFAIHCNSPAQKRPCSFRSPWSFAQLDSGVTNAAGPLPAGGLAQSFPRNQSRSGRCALSLGGSITSANSGDLGRRIEIRTPSRAGDIRGSGRGNSRGAG